MRDELLKRFEHIVEIKDWNDLRSWGPDLLRIYRELLLENIMYAGALDYYGDETLYEGEGASYMSTHDKGALARRVRYAPNFGVADE